MGVGGQHQAPAALRSLKDPVLIVQEAGVGLRAGLDGCGKSRLPPEFDPRTVQLVASRYSDWAIVAHTPVYNDTINSVPSMTL